MPILKELRERRPLVDMLEKKPVVSFLERRLSRLSPREVVTPSTPVVNVPPQNLALPPPGVCVSCESSRRRVAVR